MSKLIAYYLPAYHEIEENNLWYGKGFTEWDNTKKGVPLYENHYQPRIPLNNNYYNLLDNNVLRDHIKLANEYGVHGFCFYHYWFNGRLVLEKPAEQLLADSDANIDFCFAWANEPWRKTWHEGKGKSELLIEQIYGGRNEWLEHYEYLRKFFLDKRYIKVDNKPMLLIYRINSINNANEMIRFWNSKAIEDGYEGIHCVQMLTRIDEEVNKSAHAIVDFEPNRTFSGWNINNLFTWWRLKRFLRISLLRMDFLINLIRDTIDYHSFYKDIIKDKKKHDNHYYGVFNDFDNTARKGRRGVSFKGANPDSFGHYLKKIIDISIEKNKEFIFIFAWNEWGEGGYLEPDVRYGYGYLEAIKNVIANTDTLT